jgi:anti-anti-sigma factor
VQAFQYHEVKAMDVVQRADESVFSLEMSGSFTFADHRVFREILKKIEDDKTARKVIFRMERLEFVDSAALGMLLLAHDAASSAGKRLVIKGAAGQVKKMFALAHFQRLFVLE